MNSHIKSTKIKHRLIVALGSVLIGVAFITTLSLGLPKDSVSGAILFDLNTRIFVYPATVQNIMWLFFFISLGELWIRYREGSLEYKQLTLKLLPEDPTILLRPDDLKDIIRDLNRNTEHAYLPRLLKRVILQFQVARSIDQSNSLMNTSLELYQHEIDLKYNMLRYLVWLIPSFGFIGTVIGIAAALGNVERFPGINDPNLDLWMKGLALDLAVAFYTTLLALLQSVIIVFFLHICQEREEMALNFSGQYCMDNLIGRLYLR